MEWRVFPVVVVMVSAITSNAAVLCTGGSGSGTVRVRATCRPRETQLDPVALGLQGPPGPSSVVMDSNGRLVGVINATPTDDTVIVTRKLGSDHLLLTVTVSGFRDSVDPPTQRDFETADCSGPAYSGAPTGGGLFR